ncbi:pseudouridylate synthase 7 homolog isoform X2 [Orussus abietinus]|uniref:pseudouridylate synthase 7 homolog isoform X2 n=1 Tax=Orussus abietinus TaxID=222816 RepID=UPI00062550EF|nr:pseudouridylate synthase 7 homolog isoform X2 [Orussus abietinus]
MPHSRNQSKDRQNDGDNATQGSRSHSDSGSASSYASRRYQGNRRNFSRKGRGDGWNSSGGGRSYGYYSSYSGNRGYKRTQMNYEKDGKRPKLEVGNRLKEIDIGVTEFIGDHEGFSGVIKERYADFHVHEISVDNEIAKLIDQSIPPAPEELANMDDLKKNIPASAWNQLEQLMEADSNISSVEINVTNIDKEQRRAIHTVAKKIQNVISQTVDQEDQKIIVITKSDKKSASGHRFRSDQMIDWARRGGSYCHFMLHKVNMDTMDALNQMAMYLGLKVNTFNYAGTKDRRARTTQWVSLKKINPVNILQAGKAIRGAYVGNFKFCEEPQRLGLLSGNRFRIALRNVTGSDEQIEKAMTSLRDNGFINYYGLQRFGTVAAIPTHEIGKALLQRNWDKAVELILKPRAGEQQRELINAREIFEKTKDPQAAYDKIRRPDQIEAKLLQGLCSCGINNPQGALDWIPRYTRLIYIHAYQSFVWNEIVSRRIREFGRKPIVGDLVYENSNFKEGIESLEFPHVENGEESGQSCQEIQTENNDEGTETTKTDKENRKADLPDESVDELNKDHEMVHKVKEDETATINPGDVSECTKTKEQNEEVVVSKDSSLDSMADDGGSKDEVKPIEACKKSAQDDISLEVEKETMNPLPAVKVLTEKDLPNYTLADVVIPQPGYAVTYPTYAKEWVDEMLAKDGLTTDLRQKNKKYTLRGAYRKILEIPSNLSWHTMRYVSKYDDLILSDVDEMRKLTPPKDQPDGKYKALIVEMSLKPSTYATMALREILKCDTSPQTQAAQSAAHEAQEDEGRKVEDEKKEDTEGTKETEKDAEESKENIKDLHDNPDLKKIVVEKEVDEVKGIVNEKTEVNTKVENSETVENVKIVEDDGRTDKTIVKTEETMSEGGSKQETNEVQEGIEVVDNIKD